MKPADLMLPLKKNNPLILVADDDRGARLLLRGILEQRNYSVAEAKSGQECLAMCELTQPDLVLLDAMMPGLDGFETCIRLRQLPQGESLPILIVTSLEDSESVDKAFEVGVTDYITKPIHFAVLLQRVRRLLESKALEQMRSDLTHMIVHDMKTPLGAINNYSELLLAGIVGQLDTDQNEVITRIRHNSKTLLDMTTMILDLKRIEEGKLTLAREPVIICDLLRQVKDSLEWMAQNQAVQIKVECEKLGHSTASFDKNLMQRVLTNLTTNAIKHSSSDTTVTLTANFQTEIVPPGWYIIVKDQGEGIALEDQNQIFDRFTQATFRSRGSRTDTGLGLTFCKLAVEAHGGYIQVESTPPNAGSTFTLVFPITH